MEKGGVDLGNASLSDRFARFARQECAGSCDLYEHLAQRIAADDELLRIASHARPGQPVPNLLFGAVQYLLLAGADHELRRYYDGLVEEPGDIRQSFPPFKDFCLKYADDIVPLLKTKIVQTNEVRRCAYLYPSFCLIYENIRKPLALIEIGTSAGLQLLWDQYGYSYGSGDVYGNPAGAVRIAAAIIGGGDTAPPLLPYSPPVTVRIGVDLHINRLSDPEDHRWLRALIWPGHRDRVALFDDAARCLTGQPVKLIEGDGIELLPSLAAGIPDDAAICVFHTHVANQMPPEAKRRLEQQIREMGSRRDLFHLYNNMWDANLHLDEYIGGVERRTALAETEGHGRWFRWIDPGIKNMQRV
ncbi:DUF2332 domain-containing protein [Paenibacillus dendritiformis]|uniref:DUF2332 domain-containing protein n=1 Tax=Paenibacillus dendritiformis TaxID=130049 RepID=UPI00387E07DB